jgi:hypothetical protein
MIIGHQKVQEQLYQSITKHAFFQAYLFSGPESVGKFTLAEDFAEKLIDDGSNPLDKFVLLPETEIKKGVTKTKYIKAKQVIEALHWLATFPYSGKKKVLIIRNAQRMTETAQNALLKTLEEPPAFAVILLVTDSVELILPTIRSRCQHRSFSLVDEAVIREGVCTRFGVTALSVSLNELCALGRPGIVCQSYYFPEDFAVTVAFLEEWKHLSEKSVSERLMVAESMAGNIPRAQQSLAWFAGFLEHQTKNASGDPLVSLLLSLEKVEELHRNLQKFAGSGRALLDTFVLHW